METQQSNNRSTELLKEESNEKAESSPSVRLSSDDTTSNVEKSVIVNIPTEEIEESEVSMIPQSLSNTYVGDNVSSSRPKTVIEINGQKQSLDEYDQQPQNLTNVDCVSETNQIQIQNQNTEHLLNPLSSSSTNVKTLSEKRGLESMTGHRTKNKNGTLMISGQNCTSDTLSLRETLQQLPTTISAYRNQRHRNISPRASLHKHREDSNADVSSTARGGGILSFVDRELKQTSPTLSTMSGASNATITVKNAGRKQQSFSDPTGSPAQVSLHSRISLEHSPRRKRNKSESKRRRERKLIAAGEVEVRKANETLMHYMKQCTEVNDATLSGELEIDKNLQGRKMYRECKFQRDKRNYITNGDEIYNPFTPVVSPTIDDESQLPIDNIFIQMDNKYRLLDHHKSRQYRKHHPFTLSATTNGNTLTRESTGTGAMMNQNYLHQHHHSHSHGYRNEGILAIPGSSDKNINAIDTNLPVAHNDTCCLLDSDYYRRETNGNIDILCQLQRIWMVLAMICHGLLAGLALTHLLFVMSINISGWSSLSSLSDQNSLSSLEIEQQTITPNVREIGASQTAAFPVLHPFFTTSTQFSNLTNSQINQEHKNKDKNIKNYNNNKNNHKNNNNNDIIRNDDQKELLTQKHLLMQKTYLTFSNIYLKTFYCLTVVCILSVFDRMDICRWSFGNTSTIISFRWLIILMIYIATLILAICTEFMKDLTWENNLNEKTNTTNINDNLDDEQQQQQSTVIMFNKHVASLRTPLVVSRSIGAFCGWILVSLTPPAESLIAGGVTRGGFLTLLLKCQFVNN